MFCVSSFWKYRRTFSTSKKLSHAWRNFWRQSTKLMSVHKSFIRYWFIKLCAFFSMIKRDSTYTILTRSIKYRSWFAFIRCMRFCSHAFKQFRFSSYSIISKSFSKRKMKKEIIMFKNENEMTLITRVKVEKAFCMISCITRAKTL